MPSFFQKSLSSHYYVLKNLCSKIEEDAKGFYFEDCISLNKNELIFRFRYKDEKYIFEAYLGDSESFIFFPEKFSSPTNSKYYFPELNNQKLVSAKAHWHDRSYSLYFEDFSLYFKMYGRNANIILFKNNKLISLFRKQFLKDHEINPFEINKKQIDINDLNHFEKLKNELSPERAIQNIFPSYNATFLHFLELQDWENKSTIAQWQTIRELNYLLEKPVYYILKTSNKPEKNDPGIIFSFFHFGEEILYQTDEVKEALNAFAREYLSARNFFIRKNRILEILKQKEEKLKYGLVSAQKHLQHLDEDKNYRMQADILMANLHQISAAATEVELYDFFHDKNITIKLKKDISPQKWAEKLYQKSKNQEIEREKVLEKIISLENALVKNEEELEKTSAINNNKDLRMHLKNTEIKDVKNQKNNNQQTLVFKRFEFEKYEVFVGKSAKNNDELTLKFAKKDDIWLHARGVSGSHVIIRKKGNNPVPISVIRKAAQLAAYYSKGKSASLCPVIYTPKKFVRKPKGANPGAVIVEREEVIFAEPSSFGEID